MPHRRFEFPMPAPSTVVFEAFHNRQWRARWDSLVQGTVVEGGGDHPFVGAVTQNPGKGLLRALSMRTRFISYQPGVVAAAEMVGVSWPFRRWAASLRHRDLADGRGSVLIYTYSFETSAPRRLLEPLVQWAFDRETRRRFGRLADFLSSAQAQNSVNRPRAGA